MYVKRNHSLALILAAVSIISTGMANRASTVTDKDLDKDPQQRLVEG